MMTDVISLSSQQEDSMAGSLVQTADLTADELPASSWGSESGWLKSNTRSILSLQPDRRLPLSCGWSPGVGIGIKVRIELTQKNC